MHYFASDSLAFSLSLAGRLALVTVYSTSHYSPWCQSTAPDFMRLLPRGKVPTPNMYVKVLSLSPTGSQQSRELSEPQGKGINGRVDWTGLAFVSVHFSQLYCLPRDSKILSLSEMSLDSSTCHSGYRTMATMRLGIYNCE